MARRKRNAGQASPNNETEQILKKHIELKKLIKKAAKHASVLFADMVGSTAFKEDHEALDALEKPYQHHLAVCEIVEQKQHGGQVIKSLGDGVMVMFVGEECERRAVTAGLEVLEALRKRNDAQKPKNADASIQTRIGIHSGPVWTLMFPQSKVEDPQGTTVDVAARLCALARAEQLLCTEEETLQKAGGEEIFKNAGKAGKRFLKGVADRLRMVLPEGEGWNPTDVPISGYRPPPRPGLKEQLDKACDLFLMGGKHLDKAYAAFNKIADADPDSFEARFALSSIMLMSDAVRLGIHEECERLRRHLAVATQGNPRYFRVWLLVGLARLRRFELHGRHADDLELAFEHTEAALALASQDLDVPGIVECRMQLAGLLLTRAQRACPDEGAADLAAATKLCTDVKPILDGHLERNRLQYIATEGRIRMEQATKHEELNKIEEAFNSAIKENGKSPAIMHAIADLWSKREVLPETGTD